MKRIWSIVLLALMLNFAVQPFALSGTVRYAPGKAGDPGTLNGESTTSGLADLGKTRVSITGNVIDILSEIDLTKKRIGDAALRGTAFGTKSETAGRNTHQITGFVFFDKGTALSKISDPSARDRVTLQTGRVITGSITTVSSSEIAINTGSESETVRVSEIAEVSSPQVYKFSAPIKTDTAVSAGDPISGETDSVKFTPTYKATTAKQPVKEPSTSVSSPAGMSKAKKCLIVAAGLAIIATAIAVPIAVPLANRNRNGLAERQKQFANLLFVNSLTARAAPVEPPPPPPEQEISP